MSRDVMKLALEALETERPYLGPMPTKTSKAITALREALAEQPAQKCSYPYCGCSSKAWCKVERNEALDKMADNERELGIQMEPAQDDPCPGCRKGCVCRTPKCGRLKLPVDHPYRSEQPAQHLSGLAVYLDPSDGLKPKRYAPQPAQRTWVGLTNQERENVIYNSMTPACVLLATEAKLKEKNT